MPSPTASSPITYPTTDNDDEKEETEEDDNGEEDVTAAADAMPPSPPPMFELGLSAEAVAERNTFVLYIYGKLRKLRRNQRRTKASVAAIYQRVESLEAQLLGLRRTTG